MFKLTHKEPSWDDILGLIVIIKRQQEQLVQCSEILEVLSDRVINIEKALVYNANIIEKLIKRIPGKGEKNGRK